MSARRRGGVHKVIERTGYALCVLLCAALVGLAFVAATGCGGERVAESAGAVRPEDAAKPDEAFPGVPWGLTPEQALERAERELELLRATRALDAEKAMQANARWVNKWAGILWLAGLATAAASFFVPVIPRKAAFAGVGLGFIAWGTGYVLLRWGAMLATWGFIVSLVGLIVAGVAWAWPLALAYYRRHLDKTADELTAKGHHAEAVALEVVAGTVPFAERKARLAELAGVTA